MRVTTAFNRMLRLPGASVIDVTFGAEGVIVTVRLRHRRRVCSGCGQLGGSIHGRRVKRWRHLDLGANRCVIECELRRLWCWDCGVRYEAVPWSVNRKRTQRLCARKGCGCRPSVVSASGAGNPGGSSRPSPSPRSSS